MNQVKKPPVVLIVGPTGVGKTALSIKVAKAFDTEIISCDSMQIYKHMDIGTAKVTEDEADGVLHHMTDIAEPFENYSVCEYVNDAKEIISDMTKRGKLPVIVGGTGLYADSLLGKMSFEDTAPTDEKYREELYALAEEKGVEFVHKMLSGVDKKSADTIHPNNVKRVIRALEYYKATGKPISLHNEESKKVECPYNAVKIGLIRSRENLYKRIDQRVDIMLKCGLEDEVKKLIQMGLKKEHTSMQAIGYKEIAESLSGSITLDEAAELIKRDSRRYAKRQLTWFRRDNGINWINLDETTQEDALAICRELIEKTLKGN